MAQKKHILIVDDDVELGDLLAEQVGYMSDDFEVKVARNVDEAMVLVRRSQTTKQPFHLVITDIKMTGLSGLELLEALKAIAPETKSITMTAYNSPELAQHAQALGVCAHLIKPFIMSEFRQIVHDALRSAPVQPTEQPSEPAPELSSAQKAFIAKQLAALRTMTGASATLLAHTSGTILAMDALEPETDVEELCHTLMTIQQELSLQMSQTFDSDIQMNQSYFGTDTHNICTYRLDESYIAAVIFGPAVKEGQIWYYMRDTVDELKGALTGRVARPTTRQQEGREDVFAMLDQFFPDRQKTRRSRRRAAPATPPSRIAPQPVPATPEQIVAEPEPVEATPAYSEALIEQIEAEMESLVTTPPADLPPVDDIDWDVSIDMDWDSVVESTDQGFGGISFEDAKQRGLLAGELAQAVEQGAEAVPEPAFTPAADAPSLDDIDWSVPDDMDWDSIVSETDQGLGGISFEEAKRQGLISDLDG